MIPPTLPKTPTTNHPPPMNTKSSARSNNAVYSRSEPAEALAKAGTRIGKIARLPAAIRDELNTRLHDGERGPSLLRWLNALPAVSSILAAQFAARPVSAQNLSEWRQGGFTDWLRAQEARAWVDHLREEAARLRADPDHTSVSAYLAAPLAVALGHCLQQAATKAPDHAAQREALFAIAFQLHRLRRCDHAESLLRLKQERWRAKQARAEIDAQAKLVETQERLLAAKVKAEEDTRHAERVALMRAKFYGQLDSLHSRPAPTTASAQEILNSIAPPRNNPATPPPSPAPAPPRAEPASYPSSSSVPSSSPPPIPPLSN